jgi:hypothetical protein
VEVIVRCVSLCGCVERCGVFSVSCAANGSAGSLCVEGYVYVWCCAVGCESVRVGGTCVVLCGDAGKCATSGEM